MAVIRHPPLASPWTAPTTAAPAPAAGICWRRSRPPPAWLRSPSCCRTWRSSRGPTSSRPLGCGSRSSRRRTRGRGRPQPPRPAPAAGAAPGRLAQMRARMGPGAARPWRGARRRGAGRRRAATGRGRARERARLPWSRTSPPSQGTWRTCPASTWPSCSLRSSLVCCGHGPALRGAAAARRPSLRLYSTRLRRASRRARQLRRRQVRACGQVWVGPRRAARGCGTPCSLQPRTHFLRTACLQQGDVPRARARHLPPPQVPSRARPCCSRASHGAPPRSASTRRSCGASSGRSRPRSRRALARGRPQT
jgi:hypothetical protein